MADRTRVRLVQGYFAGLDVPQRRLGVLLEQFGVKTPPPSPPTSLTVARELIVARAGLGPDFFWQDMPDGYHLMTEGDPKAWGHIPNAEPVNLDGLPGGLRGAFQWAIDARRSMATPSAIQRTLAMVAFHYCKGISVANLRGLPGAIVIPPQGASGWATVESELITTLPTVHARLICTGVYVAGAIEAAVFDELVLTHEMADLEVARLRGRLLDTSAEVPGSATIALALGRTIQARMICQLWEDLAVERQGTLRSLTLAFEALVQDLYVMLGTTRQETP